MLIDCEVFHSPPGQGVSKPPAELLFDLRSNSYGEFNRSKIRKDLNLGGKV